MNKTVSRAASTFLLVCLLFSLTAFTPANRAMAENGPLAARITQVDTSQFPMVTVYVSVTDANGEPVEVGPSSLVLKENGEEMKPESIQGVGETEEPLTTLLIVDVSGSMNTAGKLEAAKNAARSYVEQTRPNDLVGLLSFNTRIDYVQPITQNRDAVLEAISELKAKDDTAMYDALMQGIKIIEGLTGRKAIIVLTDGMDNRSKSTPKKVVERIGPSGLSISTIGLGNPEFNRGVLAGLDEAALEYLAEHAGGVYGYANDANSLARLYERYGRTLQSEYAITYKSPAALRDGVNRALEVSVKAGGQVSSSAAADEETTYNPGGLVPEVAQPASWGVFLIILAGLAVLLAAPALIRRFAPGAGKSGAGRVKLTGAAPARKSARIKLKR